MSWAEHREKRMKKYREDAKNEGAVPSGQLLTSLEDDMIECPHCREIMEQEDVIDRRAWPASDEAGVNCPSCSKPFKIVREFSVSFSTWIE